MGRKITDGKAIDVVVADGEEVVKGEIYRIDNFTGFAMDDIATDADARDVALERTESLWRCQVPSGVAGTRGYYLKWSSGTGFKYGGDDLENEASALVKTGNTVAQVESVRNSDGYATLKLVL